jgi:hypothetical protein
MKQIKKTKFTLEKFEVARLKSYENIVGGIGDGVDPITGTQTSKNCSDQPGCKIIIDAPVRPPLAGSL